MVTVCLTIHFFFRVKPVREGERRSRRKLGLAPEFKASDLPVRTRWPRVLVQAPQPVPVIDTLVCTSGAYDPWATTGVGGYTCDQTSCFIAYSCSFSRCRRWSNGWYRLGGGKWSVLCRFGGDGSRACFGDHKHPSCSCCPFSPERLNTVVYWCCSCCR